MPTRPTISYHASLAARADLGWRDSLQVARDAGYSAIDVILPDAAEPAPGGTPLAGLDAGPASLPVEFRLDEERFAEDLTLLPELADAAARLGVQTMYRSVPASSDTPASELRSILRRRVSLCASILAQHGIGFAVEVLGPLHRRTEAPHEFIWRLSDGAEFVSSCGPGVGLLVDSWHWHHAGGTSREISDVASEILHVHVADAPDLPPEAIRDDQRLLPGEGVVNFEAFLGALAGAGYSRMISPEVRGYRCDGYAVSCAAAALDAVERELDRHFLA
jgi:sugar phosphate isomerase/epimerase